MSTSGSSAAPGGKRSAAQAQTQVATGRFDESGGPADPGGGVGGTPQHWHAKAAEVKPVAGSGLSSGGASGFGWQSSEERVDESGGPSMPGGK